MTLTTTIAGAGIGGLAAATALAQNGATVKIAERAARLEAVGAGLQISPNGAVVLKALGLEPELTATSLRAEAVRLVDGLTGRKVAELDLTRRPDQSWSLIHRADLIDMLHRAALAAGATLTTGTEITPPTDGAPGPEDDLLIGADGVKSAVRRAMDPEAEAHFTGQVAWRAVIPETDAAPIVEVHMGPGRHLVSYPLPGHRRNIVAVEERGTWADEGWSHEDDPQNLRRAFARFKGPVPEWFERIETVHLWGLFRHPVAQRWFAGQQVLLGDAAHPTLPFLAQGANLALEDAWVLSQALTRFDLPVALERYQTARKTRATHVVDAATKNARNYHLRPPVRWAAHTALRAASALTPERMISRFDWLYRHDVTTDPF